MLKYAMFDEAIIFSQCSEIDFFYYYMNLFYLSNKFIFFINKFITYQQSHSGR